MSPSRYALIWAPVLLSLGCSSTPSGGPLADSDSGVLDALSDSSSIPDSKLSDPADASSDGSSSDASLDAAKVDANQPDSPDVGPATGLDPTFGVDGVSLAGSVQLGPVSAADLQLDGKLLMAGSDTSGNGWKGVVVRLLANGALDTTFGASGKVVIDAGTAQAISVLPGGKILVAARRLVTIQLVPAIG